MSVFFLVFVQLRRRVLAIEKISLPPEIESSSNTAHHSETGGDKGSGHVGCAPAPGSTFDF